MPPDRNQRGDAVRQRRGFSLLELLIVVAIVMVLVGLTISCVTMIKERAREHATMARMQNILNGLTQYAASDGSPGVGLQIAYDLGGVPYFAQISNINNYSITSLCAKPPGFMQWTWVPPIATPAWSQAPFDATNYSANPERITLWRRLIDDVYDAKPPAPPAATWASAADYMAAGQPGAWPTQWPETDWDLPSPGVNPPILRFPWGKPGLRVDGAICDPNLPSGPTTTKITEKTTSAGLTKENPPEAVLNNWVTTGAPATSRIWDWTASDPNQTDGVTLTGAHRSSDLAINIVGADPLKNANAPMPFDEGWMSPLKSIQLLQAAGVLQRGAVGEGEYRNGRSGSQPWNDAWGHPLVVVYAMFQPERYVRTFDGQNRRDLLLRSARKEYQYNRSCYFAVGAPGYVLSPTLAPPLTWAAGADATTLRDYWLQIRDVADAATFTEASFSSAPWKGVKVGKKAGMKCMLTAPVEIK